MNGDEMFSTGMKLMLALINVIVIIIRLLYRSFWHASPHLWNMQLPTSLRIPLPYYYSSHSQRPSFEHAGLTCYILSPSITFHCFALSSKLTLLDNLKICFCLLVGLISWLYTVYWSYLHIGFYVLVLFLSVLVIPRVRQTT